MMIGAMILTLACGMALAQNAAKDLPKDMPKEMKDATKSNMPPGAPPVPNLTKENQQSVIDNCNKFLDQFIGKWEGTQTIDGQEAKIGLEFERFVQNQFIRGSMTVKNSKGEIVSETAFVLSFNSGGMQFLLHSFESSGWDKVFIGPSNPSEMMLQGMTPEGMEHYRWKLTADGKLERAYWAPVKGQATAQGDPQEVLVFKKL